MLQSSKRLLQTIPKIRSSFFQPFASYKPKRSFSNQPGTNFDEIMSSSKSKFPTTSVAIGLTIAAAFAYYQFYLPKSSEEEAAPQINRAKADLLNPEGPKVSVELRKEIGAEGKDDISTALRLQDSAKGKFSLDNYDEVVDLLELALQILRNVQAEESSHGADIYFDLGFYQFHNRDISKSREAFNKAYELYAKNKNDEKAFDALDMLALTYDKNPEGGEPIFEKIIQKSLDKSGDANPGLAKAYIQYGVWNIKNNKGDAGVKLLGKALETVEKCGKKGNSEDLGPIVNQLLNAYSEAGAVNQGIKASESTLKYIDINKNPGLLVDIAGLYSEGNESKKSIEFYRKYLSTLKTSGKDSYAAGKIIQSIASEYEKQKEDQNALASWKEFNGLFDSSNSKEIKLMSVYGRLRSFALYNRRGKTNEATKELEEAYSKAEGLLGNNHMYSLTLNKILSSYKANSKEPKLDLDSLTLILIALEDNLQKLIDTGFINL